MVLYAKHLGACSSVALDISQKLVETIGDETSMPKLETPEGKARGILRAVGVDSVVSSSFHTPIPPVSRDALLGYPASHSSLMVPVSLR